MSIKKALIESFFKTRITPFNNSITVQSQDPEFLPQDPPAVNPPIRSQSFSNLRLKPIHSRPSSVCSSNSTKLEKFSQFDPDFPHSFTSAIQKLTIRTLQNFQRNSIDDNSLCLIYSFLLLISIEDYSGPANSIKSAKSKIIPVFYQYLKNSAVLVRLIRTLPKALKNMKKSDLTYKKATALFRIVDSKKLKSFLEIFEYVKEALAYVELCKTQKTEESKKNGRGDSLGHCSVNLVKKSRKLSMGNLKEEVNKTVKNGLGVILKESSGSSRAEKFLMESRANKRIQEKLVKFVQGKNVKEEKEKILKEFVSKLPLAEVNRSTMRFIEIFFNKNLVN